MKSSGVAKHPGNPRRIHPTTYRSRGTLLGLLDGNFQYTGWYTTGTDKADIWGIATDNRRYKYTESKVKALLSNALDEYSHDYLVSPEDIQTVFDQLCAGADIDQSIFCAIQLKPEFARAEIVAWCNLMCDSYEITDTQQ